LNLEAGSSQHIDRASARIIESSRTWKCLEGATASLTRAVPC
jgi:hypothetical protein